ncbi:MAG: phage holin family protein [Patescibacteria group bacterium]
MKLISRLIFHFFSNLIAFLATIYFIEGIKISPNIFSFFMVAGAFTLINIFIRPILKLILSPIIILTLGLGIFLVNALMLYLVDIFLADITITGLRPLIYATLIISVINILIHFSAKRIFQSNRE